MHKTSLRLPVFFLILSLTIPYAFSQRTLVETDPVSLFRKAAELYENQKYAAALETFDDFIKTNKSDLLGAEAFYMMAMSAKNIDLKSTEELFALYLEKYPEQNKVQDVYFQLGKYTYDNKKYENTYFWLKKIENPKYLDIPTAQEYFFMLAYSSYKTEKYDEALKAFSELDSYTNPYFNTANYYKGYIYYRQDKLKEALDNFLKIQDYKKLSDIIPVYVTNIYLRLGDYTNVVNYGTKALETPTVQKRVDIQRYIAQAYFRLKNYPKALEMYLQLEEKNGNFQPDEMYNFGYCLLIDKQYQKAASYLSQINPEESGFGQNVAYNLGIAYQKSNESMRARNMFSLAMKLGYDKDVQEQSALSYAKLSYELNFQREAINSLRDFIKKFPASKNANEAKSLLSEFLLASSNYKEALSILDEIPDKNYDVKNTYQQVNYFYALDLFKNGKYDEAKEKFLVSQQNEINVRYSALSYFWIGECEYQQGKINEALKNYKNFLYLDEARKTPYYSLGYYNLGYTYYKLEKYKDARASFAKYIDLEDNEKHTARYFDATLRLGDCSYALKDYNKALFYYNSIISNSRQDVDYALYQKAFIQGLQGQKTAKIATLNIITDKYPKSSFADDAAFEIGHMLLIEARYSEALSRFNSFIENYPRSPNYITAKLNVARCYNQLDMEDKAIENLKSIVKEFPYADETKEALAFLAEIYTDNGKGSELIEYLKSVPNIKLTASFQDSAVYYAAYSYVKKNNCEEATKALDGYLKSFPNGYFVVSAHFHLANCAGYLAAKDMALQHYEIISDFGFSEYYEKSVRNAADLLYSYKKDFQNAAKRYKQLEEASSSKENTLFAVAGLMRSYNRLSNFEQSKAYAEKLLTLTNATPEEKLEAQYYIGVAQYELKVYDLALATLKMVSEANKDNMGAEAKYLTANIQYSQEQYDEATKTILELNKNYPNSDYFVAKGFILLADICVKKGDLFQAESTLESIISNSDYPELVNIARQKKENIALLKSQISKSDSLKTKTDTIFIRQGDLK